MYYELNQEGKINAISEEKFSDNAIWTDEEIVYDYDGRLVFKKETESDEYKRIKSEKDKEKNLNELRYKRVKILEAFDKWEKAVLRGRESDDLAVMEWYQRLLDLDELAFDSIPIRIQYYIG